MHEEAAASSVPHETMLNVMVTGSWLSCEASRAIAQYDITLAQYNVLRILQSSHPGTLTCSEVGCRLFDRTPDVTRLLNRLEKQGLIGRNRSDEDRRVVEVCISEAGLDLLRSMQDDVSAFDRELEVRLTHSEMQRLNFLLDKVRGTAEKCDPDDLTEM
jgi:DNA-binding MarR family transcriptional regulator